MSNNCRKLPIIRLSVVKVVDHHRQRHRQLAHKSGGSFAGRIQREDEVMHLLLPLPTAAGTLMACHLGNSCSTKHSILYTSSPCYLVHFCSICAVQERVDPDIKRVQYVPVQPHDWDTAEQLLALPSEGAETFPRIVRNLKRGTQRRDFVPAPSK